MGGTINSSLKTTITDRQTNKENTSQNEATIRAMAFADRADIVEVTEEDSFAEDSLDTVKVNQIDSL